MRYLYNILSYLSIPVILIRLLWRARKLPAYKLHWNERFGDVRTLKQSPIWFHAVSVGETLAAVPLILGCIKKYPGTPIVVTNMTPTGRERVEKLLKKHVYNCYVPYDIPYCVDKFMARVKPKALIVMETELWPNMIRACRKADIPVIVSNARMSEKSAQGYTMIEGITKGIMKDITHVSVQSEMDGLRYRALSLPREKMTVTGSVKYDIKVSDEVREKAAALQVQLTDRLVWVAASTHEGEEALILKAHQRILESVPNALLILVPRHPDRFKSVATLVEKNKVTCVLRSGGEAVTSETQVLLGDTMGEVMVFFAVCHAAFVGGSLKEIGGHNLLEPAVLSKPIVTGPHLFNFADIAESLQEAGAMEVVQNEQGLISQVLEWFQQPDVAQAVGEKGLGVIEANRGCVDRQMAVIEKFL